MTSTRASNTVLARQDATPPKVEGTIPDLSKKVPTDLKEIRIVFNEKMTGEVSLCGHFGLLSSENSSQMC